MQLCNHHTLSLAPLTTARDQKGIPIDRPCAGHSSRAYTFLFGQRGVTQRGHNMPRSGNRPGISAPAQRPAPAPRHYPHGRLLLVIIRTSPPGEQHTNGRSTEQTSNTGVPSAPTQCPQAIHYKSQQHREGKKKRNRTEQRGKKKQTRKSQRAETARWVIG